MGRASSPGERLGPSPAPPQQTRLPPPPLRNCQKLVEPAGRGLRGRGCLTRQDWLGGRGGGDRLTSPRLSGQGGRPAPPLPDLSSPASYAAPPPPRPPLREPLPSLYLRGLGAPVVVAPRSIPVPKHSPGRAEAFSGGSSAVGAQGSRR